MSRTQWRGPCFLKAAIRDGKMLRAARAAMRKAADDAGDDLRKDPE